MTSIDLYCSNSLKKLEEQKLLRELKNFNVLKEHKLKFKNQIILNFASNDYFALAEHKDLINTAKIALDKFGLGAKSSRLICGNHDLYNQLEGSLANFHDCDSALVFGSGYLASTSLLPALCDRNDLIIADKLIHSCLIDGSLLSKATLLRYPHNNLEILEHLIIANKHKYKKILIVTETIFSMDGDRADISEIIKIAEKHKVWLLTDNAHGFGLCDKFNYYENHIKMGTLSKAIGCYGGYVAGSKNLCDLLLNKAKGLVYTTALPANIIAAAIKAIEIIKAGQVVDKLLFNIDFFSKISGLKNLNSPIFIKEFSDIEQMNEKYEQLLRSGFYVGAIRPPTVKNPRLRISINANHSKNNLAKLANLLDY